MLVGHSRGGEGVDRASINLPTDEGYHVTGQVLIGPTDFGFQAAPATPTVTILPYCDGDVSDLEGQNFTDDGRDVTDDPTHDLAFHSSVLVMGADHNFFNSEWTPGSSVAPSVDDWYGPKKATCGSKTPRGSGRPSSARSVGPTSPAPSTSSRRVTSRCCRCSTAVPSPCRRPAVPTSAATRSGEGS